MSTAYAYNLQRYAAQQFASSHHVAADPKRIIITLTPEAAERLLAIVGELASLGMIIERIYGPSAISGYADPADIARVSVVSGVASVNDYLG